MYILAPLALCFIIFRLIPRTSEFSEPQLADSVRFTTLAVPCYQLADAVQSATILGMSTIPYPASVISFFRRIGGIVDVQMYSLECKMDDDRAKYAMAYVAVVNILPIIFFSFVLIVCMPSALAPALKRMRLPSPILGLNLIFAVTSAFFMMIFNFALNLSFQKYNHPVYPKSHDPKSSLVAFPFLLTETNDVKGMRLFSAFSIAIWGVLLVVIPGIIVWVLPKKTKHADAAAFYSVSRFEIR